MEKIVCIQNLYKSFEGNVIFNDFSLDIFKNEFVIIKGPSGSGKTTLLNIIGLLEKYEKGSVEIFGESNIKAYSRKAEKMWSDKIGFLFQNYALMNDKSIKYNLQMINSKHENVDKSINEALMQVGIDLNVDLPIYKLSGGEQQRIALARLLLKQCELVLADEPTGSLDDNNKEKVMNLLKSMNDNGKTIVMVTHDNTLLTYADRVITLSA